MGHKANRDRKKNKHISQHNHLVGSQLRLLRERMLPVKGRRNF